MYTPKHLKIDFHLSVWPPRLLLAVCGFILAVIASLSFAFVWKLLFSIAVLALLLWQLRVIKNDAAYKLLFDGSQWFYQETDDDDRLAIDQPHLLFKSHFLLVLAFREPSNRRLRRIYLAHDNCPDSTFRAVCRLIN